ncbi:hypothetical protein J6590_067090 [Homalodisca vitripennis]|nr:hypothetical protein J6590_067090 [Homalodisca vitripennis]
MRLEPTQFVLGLKLPATYEGTPLEAENTWSRAATTNNHRTKLCVGRFRARQPCLQYWTAVRCYFFSRKEQWWPLEVKKLNTVRLSIRISK